MLQHDGTCTTLNWIRFASGNSQIAFWFRIWSAKFMEPVKHKYAIISVYHETKRFAHNSKHPHSTHIYARPNYLYSAFALALFIEWNRFSLASAVTLSASDHKQNRKKLLKHTRQTIFVRPEIIQCTEFGRHPTTESNFFVWRNRRKFNRSNGKQ